MNAARELSRREYEALKGATKALVKSFGSLEEAAGVTRSDPARLSRFGNVHEKGMFAPIDVIADLEARIGRPVVTAILADMLGYVLVHKEEARSRPDLVQHVGCMGKETGEAVSAVASLIDPAARTPQNFAKAHKEIREGQEALAEAEEALNAIEGNVVSLRGSAA
jgi:hypothetical protein